MPRLLVHVEGLTEEAFVNQVLREHLAFAGFESVAARLIGNARLRGYRGGGRDWQGVRREIVRHLRGDLACIATTMVDYYGLPLTWPGRTEAATQALANRASAVEQALLEDLTAHLGDRYDPRRFVPFVVMHEFEGLLFSDCAAFGSGLGRPDLIAALQAMRDEFLTPEDINDSELTAPSKRVRNLFPGYEKVLGGVAAAQAMGVDRIRRACPHFAGWLTKLEAAARG